MTRFLSVPVASGLFILAAGLLSCQLLQSPTRPSPDSANVLWSGGVTATSAHVKARLPESASQIRLATDTSGDWNHPTLHSGSSPAPSSEVVHFRLRDLSPRTTYYYAPAINGRIDTARSGRFQTFADGPFSFRVAVGACAQTGSTNPVFSAIRATEPDLFLHLGDMHYENIGRANPNAFRNAFHHVHASPPQAALYRSTPLAYVWDDHDYGPNNSSRAAPGRAPAQRAYREYVPHYDLARGDGAHPIYQAFTVGRIRFLLTDLRSARTASDAPDSTKTMMGTKQKTWFKNELTSARDRYPLIVWVSSVPWIAPPSPSADHWGGFADERRELASFVDSIGVSDQLVMVAGDAHMIALDDGTHNRYSGNGEDGFPVVHAAALDRPGSVKGGPYTHGPYPSPHLAPFGHRDGQFVQMDVRDDGGDEVCVSWTGKRYETDDAQVKDLLEWERCFPAS